MMKKLTSSTKTLIRWKKASFNIIFPLNNQSTHHRSDAKIVFDCAL